MALSRAPRLSNAMILRITARCRAKGCQLHRSGGVVYDTHAGLAHRLKDVIEKMWRDPIMNDHIHPKDDIDFQFEIEEYNL